jgi:hypothetical protein
MALKLLSQNAHRRETLQNDFQFEAVSLAIDERAVRNLIND